MSDGREYFVNKGNSFLEKKSTPYGLTSKLLGVWL